MKSDDILQKSRDILKKDEDVESKLKDICELLNSELEGYDWVGFYLVDDKELVLGPYIGEPTNHTNIDFGEGVCGQAAEREETFLIHDVKQEKNYLSCSPKVESEIVVPIFKDGEVIGEIDIDSHQRSNFGKEDKDLLEDIADLVKEIL